MPSKAGIFVSAGAAAAAIVIFFHSSYVRAGLWYIRWTSLHVSVLAEFARNRAVGLAVAMVYHRN